MDETAAVERGSGGGAGAGPGIRRLGQVAVVVADVERAKAFYRDVLELRHLFDATEAMSFVDCGGVRLMLTRAESPEHEHASSILYFDVGDIGVAHAVLAERGVEFVSVPHRVADLGAVELWMAFFRDTEGNTLALMSEVVKAGGASGG